MKNRKWIIIGLTILFIVLSILIKTDLIVTVDNLMYKIITIKMSNVITNIYKFITFLGSTEFILFLCAFFIGLFLFLRKHNKGIIISCVLLISTIVNSVLKIIFGRSRPEEVLKLVIEETYSFPSGHTMAAVSMYGILIYIVLKSNMNKKIKTILSCILGVIPVLVALSRVYLGAHYISDVIGGFLISTILLLIEIYIIDKNDWL